MVTTILPYHTTIPLPASRHTAERPVQQPLLVLICNSTICMPRLLKVMLPAEQNLDDPRHQHSEMSNGGGGAAVTPSSYRPMPDTHSQLRFPLSQPSYQSNDVPQESFHCARASEKADEYDDGCYTDRDILCEKGGRANQHAGNRVFLRLVQRNKENYQQIAHNKAAKDMVIQSILLALQRNGARFRQRCDDGSGNWTTVSWERSYTKVRQALREKDGIVHKAAFLANKMSEKRKRAPIPTAPAADEAYHSSDDSIEAKPKSYRAASASCHPKVNYNPTASTTPPTTSSWTPRGASHRDSYAVSRTTLPTTSVTRSHSLEDATLVAPPLQLLLEREDSLFLPHSMDVAWSAKEKDASW